RVRLALVVGEADDVGGAIDAAPVAVDLAQERIVGEHDRDLPRPPALAAQHAGDEQAQRPDEAAEAAGSAHGDGHAGDCVRAPPCRQLHPPPAALGAGPRVACRARRPRAACRARGPRATPDSPRTGIPHTEVWTDARSPPDARTRACLRSPRARTRALAVGV